MARYPGSKNVSERNKFVFNTGPHEFGWFKYTPKDYAGILDCVYEMSDQIANANGVSFAQAIDTVLKDENWVILPTHKEMIIKKLES